MTMTKLLNSLAQKRETHQTIDGQQKANMSLDNTSQPNRPLHDELVPSRYALRIGEIDVLVLSDGVLPLPTAMLAHNAKPALRAAWLDNMFLPPDAFDWALNVVVVRSGGQTILIDTGLGSDPNLNLPRAGQLVKRLEAAGVDLASVTDVVLTHMHMDHIGGLLVDGVKERLRPDLRIHVAAAEVKFWEAPDFSRTSMPQGFPDALRSTAKRFIKEYHGHLRTFEDEYEVAPGVVVRRTGGHTRRRKSAEALPPPPRTSRHFHVPKETRCGCSAEAGLSHFISASKIDYRQHQRADVPVDANIDWYT
jgi:glyoxylase-like metal-dependent hydrolase (beta-lactamase superfamily II)